MIRSLLERLSLRLPIRPIYRPDGQLYMKRYYVCTLWGYWRVYLHHFVNDDPDGLHNHPFKYSLSLILAGQYLEQTRFGVKTIKWFNIISGDKFHRVILLSSVCRPDNEDKEGPKWTVWSLFIHSPRICDWGFLRQMSNFCYGDRTKPDIVYFKAGEEHPTPQSDWYKTAPTGAEWEASVQKAKKIENYLN